MLKTSTFNKLEVENFLKLTGNSFAATCFYNDIPVDNPTHTQVANWFQRYFAEPNTGQYLFRLAECHCVQTSEFAETSTL